jgi:hypothetical protein
MRLTFKEKEQYLAGASRPKKDEIGIYLNKQIVGNPVIETMGVSIPQPWYKVEKNLLGDSLTVRILKDTIFAKDTLQLMLKYSDTDRKGKTTSFVDTLMLRVKEVKQIKQKTILGQAASNLGKKQTVHIYLPTDYKIESDSLHIRHKLLTKKWKEKTKYMLRLDSMAFISVFNSYNRAEDFEFSSQPVNYYANILLSLKNIKPVVQDFLKQELQDSTKKDSTSVSRFKLQQKEIDKYIGQGNLIVQLLGEKNILVREYFIAKDQDIKMDFLAPAKYTVKIIFDRNNNGKWDTGDYFTNTQPERVITNGEEVVLKSNAELEYEWNVGESLIKSFTKAILNSH